MSDSTTANLFELKKKITEQEDRNLMIYEQIRLLKHERRKHLRELEELEKHEKSLESEEAKEQKELKHAQWLLNFHIEDRATRLKEVEELKWGVQLFQELLANKKKVTGDDQRIHKHVKMEH